MKLRVTYYKLVVSIFEKYGFTVIPAIDLSTIIITSYDKSRASVSATDIRLIIEYEGLSEYITDLVPAHQVGYVMYLL